MDKFYQLLEQDKMNFRLNILQKMYEQRYANLRLFQIINGGSAISLTTLLSSTYKNDPLISLFTLFGVIIACMGIVKAVEASQLYPDEFLMSEAYKNVSDEYKEKYDEVKPKIENKKQWAKWCFIVSILFPFIPLVVKLLPISCNLNF